MTQYSKSRQQAESAFRKVQAPVVARSNALEEIDAIARARREKTARLKNARLAREADDRAAALASALGTGDTISMQAPQLTS